MSDAPLDRLVDSLIPHTRTLTAEQLAAEAGVDPDLAARVRRAMGLPDLPPDQSAYYDYDLEALRRVRALMDEGELDAQDLLHLARTLGLAAARMAEAVVEFRAERPTDVDRAGVRMDELEWLVAYMIRRHMLASITRRLTATMEGAGDVSTAVGFADLVGFTSLSEQISELETAQLIERFELVATDRIVGGGGRVVKMIGDEVMFSAEPADVGEIALGLSESFSEPDVPSVRVGLASGPVVAQSGDLFGPVVNLASRATVAARPGTVLITASLVELYRHDERYRVTPIRPRRLKGIGIVPLWSLRRASEGRRTLFTRRAG
jgi:adenylate cyclase